ncbi:MAG: bifunctional 4-hydroxy-2-oxoglutarate aldolase/2-dehydro-3-deoxy-phosphogluconate aldolase [Anaerolineales bacterium]|nr:bifunctional 4-hydroxy-2-oxoglutarate aldolase/2-dehydro-3-deoxy-phosphogluconate aldolase [Anaerolineales bacterium]
MNWVEQLGTLGVIPVVKIDQASQATQLAEALLTGGLPCVEITFRTDAALESMRSISASFPQMLLGAGTVLTVPQAQLAVQAGARYIVSPGMDRKVVEWCQAHDQAVLPGVATPSEIQLALEMGLRVLKFFPAEALGGIPYLEAIAAPFADLRFVPTGGISAARLADYLALPMVHAVGGSWLVTPRLLAAGDFPEITRLAREAVSIAASVRSRGSRK